MPTVPLDRAQTTLTNARRALLAARTGVGSFTGELSSSALSTATAVIALRLVAAADPSTDARTLLRRGLDWLRRHQNADGGFGDTPESPSNVSTTTLAWVALADSDADAATLAGVERWLEREVGGTSPSLMSAALRRRYGKDLTFSIPILTACVLGGRFGAGRQAWREFPALPFELAACPRGWFHRLGMPMVSYALPALIALGQARHHHAPSRNPIARLARAATRDRTLRVLEAIQPESGGYLEATPLTSFVAMSLVSMGLVDHPVSRRALAFLRASMRDDGSWPIDTNLDTWTTTLAVKALADGGSLDGFDAHERRRTRDWLLGQQYKQIHPYTAAAPGGFAWTDLTGGVPDGDDTPGALLALWHLSGAPTDAESVAPEVLESVGLGVGWLLDLANRDGGIPTFCRGFGALPFDRSSPDLTAHTLRAWRAWRATVAASTRSRVDAATDRAIDYLIATQREDGAWVPLWFGNQAEPSEENPLYGTSQVLRALNRLDSPALPRVATPRRRAIAWLLAAQNDDGGFGGAPGVPSSIEETGLALEALAECGAEVDDEPLDRAASYLADATEDGTRFDPAPIGLYFAKLWYHERLYPLLFTVAGLSRRSRRDAGDS